jgi:[acyl-carrier-protein] S-malonyltransferase
MSREISLIFPGQGSQHLGMLTPNLLSNYKDLILESSDLLGFDFIKLINEDPDGLLNKTSFTQPALLLTSYLHFLNFKDITNIKPLVVAGHSLGEYTALVASNSIDFFDALNLVRNRGILMESAPEGSMAAIMGLDVKTLKDICSLEENTSGLIVSCANLNSPIQTVIAGNSNAVSNVCEKAKEAGAKRAITLNVSVPSHCMLMDKPATLFNESLNKALVSEPETKIIQNFSGDFSDSIELIKSNLVKQLTGSVRWVDVIDKIKNLDTLVIECGPGKVLQGIGRSNNLSDILISSDDNFKDNLKGLLNE